MLATENSLSFDSGALAAIVAVPVVVVVSDRCVRSSPASSYCSASAWPSAELLTGSTEEACQQVLQIDYSADP